ncbi:MAG: sulfite exporter TauE/SafE family protein [Thermaerobacter sp.]|nr:sulfite exporter TauE/SafE family protein [Thermaerobacter sp.]
MSTVQTILTVLSGGVVGLSLGLLGGGGSILAVPLLLYVVGLHDPHLVIGTTALAVSLNSYINLIPHWKAGHVHWKAAILFAIPGAVGAFGGSTLGKIVHGQELLFMFALLMMVIAVIMLRRRGRDSAPEIAAGSGATADISLVKSRVRPDWGNVHVRAARVIPAGLLVGAISGFFGIGGGFLIVPGLLFSTDMPMIIAIGSSLFAVGTFGLTTAVNYALSGLVSWTVMAEYVAGGIVGGVIGARLATRLSHLKGVLNYIFAAVVIAVAIYMLYMNFHAIHG